MKRDTLLVISTSYPESGDGSEAAGSFVADVAAGLARQFPVRVLAPGRKSFSPEMGGALSVSRFASPGLPLSLLSVRRPDHWPTILRTLGSMRKQALAADSDGRLAHTLALWALPSGWAAAALLSKRGVPYSVWALGSDIWSLGRIPVARSALRGVIHKATNCYADGIQLAEDAEAIGGRPFAFLPSTRLLEVAQLRELANEPPYRMLFLGRWHPNKGIDLLLAALAELDEETWARISQIRIAGGGPMEALVHTEAAKLQVAGRPVQVNGFLDREAAAEAIGAADWVLIPSRIESVPVVFSDAMKLGRPVIVTPVGDLPTLVGESPACGLITCEISSTAIAAAIRNAVHRRPEEFAAGVGRAARTFSLDAVTARIALDTMSKNANGISNA